MITASPSPGPSERATSSADAGEPPRQPGDVSLRHTLASSRSRSPRPRYRTAWGANPNEACTESPSTVTRGGAAWPGAAHAAAAATARTASSARQLLDEVHRDPRDLVAAEGEQRLRRPPAEPRSQAAL